MRRETQDVSLFLSVFFGGGGTSCVVSGGVWTFAGVVCSICSTSSEGWVFTWSIISSKGTRESLKKSCVVRSEDDGSSWSSRCACVKMEKVGRYIRVTNEWLDQLWLVFDLSCDLLPLDEVGGKFEFGDQSLRVAGKS